jgi:hypothetical protein
MRYDGAGRLVEVTCVPDPASRQIQEASSTIQSVVSTINEVGEWISSWWN